MSFNEKFNKYYPTILAISKKFSRTSKVPVEEFISQLSEEFFVKHESYDESKCEFDSYIKAVLKQRAIRVATRKDRTFYASIDYIEKDESDKDSAKFEFVDDFNLEDYVTSKKKADQRQLIDSLLEGSDDKTTAIVSAFLTHANPSVTAIAKELGMHHQQVTRALQRLAAKFDTKQYGNYSDYLVAL